jgi:hypothetical protein
MPFDFFSDRELGVTPLNSEDISESVFNGIITIFEGVQPFLSKSFPVYCPDNEGINCGYDSYSFSDAVKGYIPGMSIIRRCNSYDSLPDKYSVLDFVEFIYENLWDYIEGSFHSFFQHTHLSFPGIRNCREPFRTKINKLFERNGIVFYLDSDGKIKRQLPLELDALIAKMKVRTSDERLNELVNQAIEDIRKPAVKDRSYSLEKLWDAFERMKTFYTTMDKKDSADKIIKNAGSATPEFCEMLTAEFKALSEIGNKFQVRHFETNKIQIQSTQHIDYLFYRMLAIINLCIESL